MRTLEVRCCCQPRKLLGWVDVPDELARDGSTLVVTVRKYPPLCGFALFHDLPPLPTVEQIRFPIADFSPAWDAPNYPALKAEGREVPELLELLASYSFRPAS
jgi:hypothetical protein